MFLSQAEIEIQEANEVNFFSSDLDLKNGVLTLKGPLDNGPDCKKNLMEKIGQMLQSRRKRFVIKSAEVDADLMGIALWCELVAAHIPGIKLYYQGSEFAEMVGVYRGF